MVRENTLGLAMQACRPLRELPTSHDLNNLQLMSGLEDAGGEFGRSDGFAIEFNDDAARSEPLALEERL